MTLLLFTTDLPAEHLANEAKLLRETAKLLPHGAVRDATIRAARHAIVALYADISAMAPTRSEPR